MHQNETILFAENTTHTTKEFPIHLQRWTHMVSGNCRIETITKEQYELSLLAPVLKGIQQQVVFGRGWALLKGLPVEQWTLR